MVRAPRMVNHRQWFEQAGLPPLQQEPEYCSLYTVAAALEHAFGPLDGPVALSTAFLAWARDHVGGERGGSNFSYITAGISRYGVCRRGLMPDVGEPSQEALHDAQTRRLVEARWIKFWDVDTGFTTAQVEACRSALAEGRVVALGARWPKSLEFGEGFVMRVPGPNDVFDGHCVALVGYREDPSMVGGGAFLFRNSWGPAWGDGGYGWMPFAYLAEYGNDAFTVAVGRENLLSNLPDGAGEVWQFEDLVPTATPGTVLEFCPPGSLADDLWSRGQHCEVRCDMGGGAAFRLPQAASGSYMLTIYGTRAPHYARFRVCLDGRPLGEVDGYNPEVKPTGPIELGVVHLDGGHTLSFEAVGRYTHGPACSGFALDCLELERVQYAG